MLLMFLIYTRQKHENAHSKLHVPCHNGCSMLRAKFQLTAMSGRGQRAIYGVVLDARLAGCFTYSEHARPLVASVDISFSKAEVRNASTRP